jgi:hypothetical protein
MVGSVDSPEGMAGELWSLFARVEQPYRDRMLRWLEEQSRYPLSRRPGELSRWLASMNEVDRLDRLLLLRHVASVAPHIFARRACQH